MRLLFAIAILLASTPYTVAGVGDQWDTVSQRGQITIIKDGRAYTGKASFTLTIKKKKYRSAYKYKAKKYAKKYAKKRTYVSKPVQWGASEIVDVARKHIGKTATQVGLTRTTLWCAAFMNRVLNETGRIGTRSDLAKSFAGYGRRVPGPQVGAIAVMSRGRGGHVGVVSNIDAKGNPIIISGNHNRRVAEARYPRGRIYAYVMP